MKQLLIILALLPILSFANETESATLEEELLIEQQLEAQEKADHVRRMAELSAMVKETEQVKEDVEDSEPWLITQIYLWGVMILGTGAIAFSIALMAASLWKSIKFNYYMFIEYGEFAWVKADSTARENARATVAEKYKDKGFEVKDIDHYTWFNALGMSLAATAIMFAMAIAWPVTIIAVGPQGLLTLIGWRKRKRVIFQKNLKGEEKDVPL